MTKLQVFDPPMCCTSGVCGTNVDTKLVMFLNDIEWLKKQGIEVERHGLAFEPDAFAKNETVKDALKQEGNECLPLLLVNNQIAYKGGYPDRKKLAEICGIEWKEEFASQEVAPVGTTTSTQVCGPDCDCHKTAVSDNSKKAIFVVVLLIIVAILVFKAFCKANAVELNNTQSSAMHLIANKQAVLGKTINSLSEINFSGQDAAFVYVPAKNNEGISSEVKSTVLKAQKTLAAKNIKTGLYTLSPSSPDYASVKAAPPAILVVYKTGGKGVASGTITKTSILQAYIAATRDCGANCPCH